jgi:hypothetical protein
MRLLCCTFLIALSFAAAQTPRDTAWSAYNAAKQNRRDLIPNLAALVEAYSPVTLESRTVTPETAAIEAVADALIQLQARLPAETVMHLYPQLPAQTIILLARATDNTAALLQMFQVTQERDLWLAAANLLALHPTPEFVRSLLDDVIGRLDFHVVLPASLAVGEGGGGCAGDYFMVADGSFSDWPKARMYRLNTSHPSNNIFAPGIHPVGFSYWETTDYRNGAWTDGDCTPETSFAWRIGVLAQLQRKTLTEFALKAEVFETIAYTSDQQFLASVKAAVDNQSRNFAEVTESFVESGELTVQDSTELHLHCRIQIHDDRPAPHSALPEVEGRWCVSAPLVASRP